MNYTPLSPPLQGFYDPVLEMHKTRFWWYTFYVSPHPIKWSPNSYQVIYYLSGLKYYGTMDDIYLFQHVFRAEASGVKLIWVVLPYGNQMVGSE
jgi:hypothetical protein